MSGAPQRTKRLIKAPKLYFADAGLLTFLLGFRRPEDVAHHALWGSVWETFVVSEVRKRVLASGLPPALWFWRTAHGDEVDLLVETGPETFVAVECKTAEFVTPAMVPGLRRLRDEYGAAAVPSALVACRTASAYPLEAPGPTRAVPVWAWGSGLEMLLFARCGTGGRGPGETAATT